VTVAQAAGSPNTFAASCVQLDDGLWEVCLQDYGIFRTSAICGTYLTV
jgi:hypothetical protein